ncbi:MAG: response regulator [Bacteroidia bacterium]|nr:response regulator [Bacteroidia bacterium]
MQAAIPDIRPLRILIVEDEAAIAAHLYRLLRSWGYEVAGTASSAAQAMRLIVRQAPDLALVNVHLSGAATGAALIPALRARRQIPVILLTGCGPDELPAGLLGQPGLHYLPKPFPDGLLRAAVAQLLGPAPPEHPARA